MDKQEKENIDPNTAFKKQLSADSDILLSDEKQPQLLDLSGSDFLNSPVKAPQSLNRQLSADQKSDDLSEGSKPLGLEKPLATPYFGSQEDVSPITNYVVDTIMDTLLEETNLKPSDSSIASNETVTAVKDMNIEKDNPDGAEFQNFIKFDNSMISELHDSDLLDDTGPIESKSDSDRVRSIKNVSFDDDSLEINILKSSSELRNLMGGHEKNQEESVIIDEPSRSNVDHEAPGSLLGNSDDDANILGSAREKGDDGISSVPILQNEAFEPVMMPRSTQEFAENLAKELISDTSLNLTGSDVDSKTPHEPMDAVDKDIAGNKDHDVGYDDLEYGDEGEENEVIKRESPVPFDNSSKQQQQQQQQQHSNNNDTYDISSRIFNDDPDISLGASKDCEENNFVKLEDKQRSSYNRNNDVVGDSDYLKHDSQVIKEEEEEEKEAPAEEEDKEAHKIEAEFMPKNFKSDFEEYHSVYDKIEEEKKEKEESDNKMNSDYSADLLGDHQDDNASATSSPPTIRPSTSSSAPSSSDYKALKKLVATTWLQVSDVLHWKNPIVTGTIFSIGLSIILAMTFFSIILVVAYYSLALMGASVALRLYRTIMQTLNKKTPIDDLFAKYLSKDITLSPEKTHEIVDISLVHLNSALIKMRSVLLVEDKFDTLKFGAFLYTLTYIGSWFNGLTLITMAYLALFTVPKFYELYKPQIDQYLNILGVHVSTTLTSVMSKVSSIASSAAQSATSTGGGKKQKSQ